RHLHPFPTRRSSDLVTLRSGREFLAIPGPTTVPGQVLQAMQRPAVDIYSGPLVQLTDSLLADLKTIFRTKHSTYIYITNGHGARSEEHTSELQSREN